jgi:hypothetical protein
MNYLAGPLTRAQIPALNQLAGAEPAPALPPDLPEQPLDQAQPIAVPPVEEDTGATSPGTQTRPTLPAGIAEYFLPNNLTISEAFKTAGQAQPAHGMGMGLLYKPVLLVQADTRYFQRKYNLDFAEKRTALVADLDPRGMIRWEDHLIGAIDYDALERTEPYNARYALLEAPFTNARTIKPLETDFSEWVYRHSSVKVFANETLKIYAGPELSEGQFRKRASEAARKALDEEADGLKDKFQKKYDALKKKLAHEQRELEEDREEHSQRKLEELSTLFENLFGGRAYGRRRVTSSITRRRLTQRAKSEIEESEDMIEEIERDIDLLSAEMEEAIDELEEKWARTALQIDEIPVHPYKKDILVEIFGVAWMPYHLVEAEGRMMELPGFSASQGY